MDVVEQDTLRELIHDARNPLNVISMNAELALMLYESPSNVDKVQSVLSTIVAQSSELDNLLATMSTFIKSSGDDSQ